MNFEDPIEPEDVDAELAQSLTFASDVQLVAELMRRKKTLVVFATDLQGDSASHFYKGSAFTILGAFQHMTALVQGRLLDVELGHLDDDDVPPEFE